MKRAGLAILLVAMLLAPVAESQFGTHEAISRSDGPPGQTKPAAPHVITVSVEGAASTMGHTPFVVVGVDTTLNVTVYNNVEERLEDTLTFNVSGASASVPDDVPVDVPPEESRSYRVPFHAEDVGLVQVRATLPSTMRESMPGSGHPPEPVQVVQPLFAAPPISVRFIEPTKPVVDDEFELLEGMGTDSTHAYARVSQEDTFTFRVEVRNVGEGTTPAFTLSLRPSRSADPFASEEIQPLEPGAAESITFEEWPASSTGRHHGSIGYERTEHFVLVQEHDLGGDVVEAVAGAFEIRSGAVTTVDPAVAILGIVSDTSVRVYAPKDLRLGVPGRWKVEVTNYARTPTDAGEFILIMEAPHGFHYGVQGSHRVTVPLAGLASGETRTRVFEFTPRVTGMWDMEQRIQVGPGWHSSGGSGFEVESPLSFRVSHDATGPARIGEVVTMDVQVRATEPVDDAVLLVAAGEAYGSRGRNGASGGPIKGLWQGLLEASPERVTLGPLATGEVRNVTIDVVAKGSGMHRIVPYVLSGGFAYTGTYMQEGEEPAWNPQTQMSVIPRSLPTGFALLPFTFVLAFVVGAWTMRTRFVK